MCNKNGMMNRRRFSPPPLQRVHSPRRPPLPALLLTPLHCCATQNYELAVKELKPANAVGIVETDLNVDFDAPVGYDESLAASNAAAAAAGTGGAGGGSSSGATGAINIPAPASGGSDTRSSWCVASVWRVV